MFLSGQWSIPFVNHISFQKALGIEIDWHPSPTIASTIQKYAWISIFLMFISPLRIYSPQFQFSRTTMFLVHNSCRTKPGLKWPNPSGVYLPLNLLGCETLTGSYIILSQILIDGNVVLQITNWWTLWPWYKVRAAIIKKWPLITYFWWRKQNTPLHLLFLKMLPELKCLQS